MTRNAHDLAILTARTTGNVRAAATMGALWDAFERKNAGTMPAPGQTPEEFAAEKVAAFVTYCKNAEAAGVFNA
jgi:hypothetical protein